MAKKYKRSIAHMLVSFVSAPFAGFALAMLASYFLKDVADYVYYAIGGAVCLLIWFITLFSENISFEIEGTKLRYYKGSKLLKEYELEGAEIGYNIKQSRSTDRVNLHINGDTIDCAPLGIGKFESMYADLEDIAGPKVQKVVVNSQTK